ncbi:lysM domain receptor-like kinase 3 [Cucumis melo var. makuwa]|uniref:LysM domain receptor-like kinase 3 n=1 Tax=Cucumis melo var. makuwa TaxID=1194695 RepID=A0A5D3CUR4_CUCMM|nr:lysM domain receptor-like kinase 3 [Cucumis melo var. makuwa]
MASNAVVSSSIFLLIFICSSTIICHPAAAASESNQTMYPMTCSRIKKCDASFYHVNKELQGEIEIAAAYSVNPSQLLPLRHKGVEDYLITAPCSCETADGVSGTAYFHDTSFRVGIGDTLSSVSNRNYSGQVWIFGDPLLDAGDVTGVKLLCGCIEDESKIVVTYTVQLHDTLSQIASSLWADADEIHSMNSKLIQDPELIVPGWVLFVPMYKNAYQTTKGSTKKHVWTIVIAVLSTLTLLSLGSLAIIFIRRKLKKSQRNNELESSKHHSKSHSITGTSSFQYPLSRAKSEAHKTSYRKEVSGFESEKTLIYSIEEIQEATANFDESRKIGEGGYGTVYHGEVAIKKMKSNKSKEFFAELKVLCRIHHINVVELLGYASGDDHLYLVYEYVSNGSLSEHLHDPLKRGYQPLSWPSRTQIALDTAKGIEYIHDHTKSRYVHRDIKTSNILLDENLEAKVADFGLVKLLSRTNDEELVATRLVGTPGYLPPESVKELQVTPKTDVFAFGVVLAELITGRKALVRENQEPKRTKSLITLIYSIFQGENSEAELEAVVDENLHGSYPIEDVYKMGEIAAWCLNENPVGRPEMREIVALLSQLMTSAVEWEASLGGNSQVFSGLFTGR